ncbi:MAG TPA: hypothetical protein VFX68_06305 [Sulfuricurvum sp.]|nr:hypothetical protein [Sulfuricurvum sp.]
MDALKLINIKSPILQLKTLASGALAVIDAQTTLRIFSADDYKIIDGFKCNVLHERLSSSVTDIASKGNYFISIISKTDKAALFSIENKELLYKLGRHQGEIESVAIDPNSRYCVTGGQDGKVFLWAIKTAKLAFSISAHSDYVTSIVFNDNGQWIATGSFDRTVNVLNLATMKKPLKLIGHTSVVVGMVFLPKSRLLSADKEGGLVVWDISSGKVFKRLPKMNDRINVMCISCDKRFVFIGTKLGYIGLYDMQSMELIKHRYLKENEEIISMTFIEKDFRLAVGTVQGNIKIYSLLGDQEAYVDLIQHQEYKAFYHLLEENPILYYSKSYELVEKIWADIFSKARLHLEKGEKAKAKELFDPFMGTSQKNALILHVLRDYEKYAQFQISAQEGRFPLAYSLAKQYPIFKDSQLYLKMETHWKHLFAKTQEIILGADGEEQARILLAPYRGISEKTALIQQLFADKRLYDYFKKVIASQNFLKFNELVKNHPFLKEFDEYPAVMEYADKLYVQALKSHTSGDLIAAKKASEILVFFPDYSKEATQLLETIKVKQLFFDALASKNYINAFSYLSSYPLLYEMPEARQLEAHWNKVLDASLRFALKGDVEGLRKEFGFYLPIAAKYVSMGSVFAQCYSVQLEQKLYSQASAAELENGIRNYVQMFGADEYIKYFFNLFKHEYTTTMNLKMLKQGSLESWMPSMLLNDITSKS